MSYLLKNLKSKSEVDEVIRNTRDRVVVMRFGRHTDVVCMQLDDILARCEADLRRFADIYTIEAEDLPIYCQYFDITLIPATIFFFNAQHMKVDYGTPDHTKFIGSFHHKQDCIDLIEVIYRGAVHGKYIVQCPIEQSRIPKYASDDWRLTINMNHSNIWKL